jgi:hypothetical protein
VEAVAHDSDPGMGHRLVRERPEECGRDRVANGLGLEVADEVGGRDVVEQRRQRVVHLRLLAGLRRGRRDIAVLARGDDVPGDDRVVPRRGPGRAGGDGGRSERGCGDSDEPADHDHPSPSCWLAGQLTPAVLWTDRGLAGVDNPAHESRPYGRQSWKGPRRLAEALL